MDSKVLSALERDAIGEILNISLGSSATALSMLLQRRVEITTPKIDIVTKESFKFGKFQPAIGVDVVYVEGLEGSNILLLKRSDVKAIYEILMGDIHIEDSEFEINEISKSAVCEVMNQMMGASATAMSDFLGRRINISPPITFEVSQEEEFKDSHFYDNEQLVIGCFELDIVGKLKSEFLYLMPVKLCRELIKAFLPAGVKLEQAAEGSGSMAAEERDREGQNMGRGQNAGADQNPGVGVSAGAGQNPGVGQNAGGGVNAGAGQNLGVGQSAGTGQNPGVGVNAGAGQNPGVGQNAGAGQNMGAGQNPSAAESLLLQQLAQQQVVMSQMLQQMQQMTQAKPQPPVQPRMIQTQPLDPVALTDALPGTQEQPENLELIMGVPLEVTVEIGRARHLIKDILEFTKGSLVVLDKLAGEQVDLLVNGQLVAKGDVVVVEDNFGVRITEIVEKPELAIRK